MNPRVHCLHLALIALASPLPSSAAFAASTLYKCIDPAGMTLYTNQKTARGTCTILSVQVPPAPTRSSTLSATAPRATRSPTPADFPKVAQQEQRARDSDRRSILEDEMRNERDALDTARKTLDAALRSNATPARELKDSVALHERNIEALSKEMAKVR